MKSRIYLLDAKIGKMAEKLREKQKSRYPDNVYDYTDDNVMTK